MACIGVLLCNLVLIFITMGMPSPSSVTTPYVIIYSFIYLTIVR